MPRPLLLALALTLPATAQAQWQLQQSNTTADLRGIHSLGNGIAWASGSHGTVLRTTDNGQTWQPCTVPPAAEALDFRGIQAFDASTAIVMSSGKGDLSRLYKTTDSCHTWKLVFTNPDKEGFWDAMGFEAPTSQHKDQRGLLIGDPVKHRFPIFVSADFGTTWTRITEKITGQTPRAHPNEALFAASNSAVDPVGDRGNVAFVTGGKGGPRMFHLVGGGLVLDIWDTLPKFEATTLKLAHRSDSEGAFSIAHREVDQVTFDYMVVGGDYLMPEQPGLSVYLAAATYSFFMRHQSETYPTTPPHGYRSAVAYSPTTNSWITVGPNGSDVSTDDGRNWRALRPSPSEAPDADENWNALSLPFVVGPHGRIGLLRPEAMTPKP